LAIPATAWLLVVTVPICFPTHDLRVYTGLGSQQSQSQVATDSTMTETSYSYTSSETS